MHIFKYINVQVRIYAHAQIAEYLDIWIDNFLNTFAREYPNIQMLEAVYNEA